MCIVSTYILQKLQIYSPDCSLYVYVYFICSGDVAGNAWNESLSAVLQNGLREDLDIGDHSLKFWFNCQKMYINIVNNQHSVKN